ncbi:MAG: hypothetical protein ACI4U2_05780, partial [Christensenellaceae bacterium]
LLLFSNLGEDAILTRLADIFRDWESGATDKPSLISRIYAQVKRLLDLATVYGFNFLFGVLAATAIKAVLGGLKKKNIVRKEYINPFLMNRVGGFFFDLMIVAGVAAIRIDLITDYLLVLLILGIGGAVITYYYNRLVAHVLFRDYEQQQFVAMYGMLTGTASTGMILLREIDTLYQTPAADNLVYQNFPAIVFGFPMMLLASLAPTEPLLTFGIVCAFFVVMNVILFRSFLFKRKRKTKQE